MALIASHESGWRGSCAQWAIALSVLFLVERIALADDWPARISKEAPLAWKDYIAKYGEIEGTVKKILNYPGGKKPPSEGRWHVKLSRLNSILTREGYGPTTVDAVFGVNDRYSFVLSRHVATAGWAVCQVVPSETPGWENRRGMQRDWAIRDLFPQFLICTERLDKLISEPSFRVTDAKRIALDGTELVRATFEVHLQPLPALTTTFHGQLLRDARHYWLPRQYDVNLHQKSASGAFDETAHLTCRIEYPSNDGDFLPKRCTVHTAAKDDKGNSNEYELVQDLDIRPRHIEEADLTLSSFGLPSEPALVKSVSAAASEVRVARTRLPNVPMRAEDESIIEYVLANDTDRDVRVIGGQFGCGPNCCCRAMNLPVTVPAHGSAVAKIGVRPARTGTFNQAVPLFFESGGLKKLVLDVQGAASPAATIASEVKP